MNRRGWRVHSLEENNNSYPPDREERSRQPSSFEPLNEEEKLVLLRNNGYLCGYRIDESDGPRISASQVAQRQLRVPLHAVEMNAIDTEVINTTDGRQTNYVHKGWSLPALSDSVEPPWMLSRISKANSNSREVESVTKRVVVQRLRVEMLLAELKPVPEFEADVHAALESSTRLEKFSSLHRVFENWGDVIPLVFDLGVSLTTTDSKSSASTYLTEKSYFGLRQLTTSGTARISTQGGDPAILDTNVQAWLHKSVPTSQWKQVRIVKVAPTTSLLNARIRTQLTELYKSLITYSPATLGGITSGGSAWDDTPHARKSISSVTICCDSYYVKSLLVTYRDKTKSAWRGGTGGTREYITELVLWKDVSWLYAIQMITDTGRVSTLYGGSGGTPEILRSDESGGCLMAFSGIVQSNNIHQLQAVWRHDMPCTSWSGERRYSQFYGGNSGSPFNDWPAVKHADSVYISSIQVKCGTYICGIRLTYSGRPSTYYGGLGGSENIFELEKNEHIVTILGRWNKYIVQLCFVTNQGRTSDIYGGGDGEAFVCRAPQTTDGKPMRLHYILGKSDANWLHGVQFVWAPL